MAARGTAPSDPAATAEDHRLRFHVFGAFECWAGAERIHVGGKQSVRILTTLLAEAGRVLPVASLVDATWGVAAPSTSGHQVRKIVADLRHRIPDGGRLILTDGPGYRVDPERIDLDLARFHRHVAAGQDAAVRDPAGAVRELRAALALWAPILAGEGGEVIDAMSELVHARYLTAAEAAMELRLALEPPVAVIADLTDLVQREPLVEALRAQLIRALYLAGRQAEALGQYDTVRRLLADELGVDPGAALQSVHHAVLTNDESALRPASETRTSVRLAPADGDVDPASLPRGAALDQPGGPSTLPRRVGDFVDREREAALVLDALETAGTRHASAVVVHGLAGVGKTSFAVHLAHELSARFPDGQLFVEMPDGAGGTTLSATLEQLFLALGLSEAEIPASTAARLDRWRVLTSRRTMLLVLDDVVSPDDAHALLLSGPGSLTLVTGRTRLAELEDTVGIPLGPLAEDDTVELLRRIVGAQRIDAEAEAAHQLAGLCGGIPLVVRLLGMQLRQSGAESVPSFIGRLEEEGRRLEDLSARGRSLAGGFRLSVAALRPQTFEALTLLAWMPWGGAPVTRAAAAAWTGHELGPLQLGLDQLLDVHLLESRDGVTLEMHDLVRAFARHERPVDEQVLAEAHARLVRYLLAGVLTAADVLAPGRRRLEGVPDVGDVQLVRIGTPAQARRWFVHHDRLLGAVLPVLTRPEDAPWLLHLARGYAVHLLETGLASTGQDVCERAVAAARLVGDRAFERLSLGNLAVFQWRGGQTRTAIETLREALVIAEETGDTRGRATLLARRGAFQVAAGELVPGCESLEEALTGFDPEMTRERASALNSLASAYLRRGLPDRADTCALESLALDDGALNAGLCHLHLASDAEARGDLEAAYAQLQQALAAYELMPGEDRLGVTHAHLAWVQALRGDPSATEHHRAATLALESVPALRRATLENLLAAADTALGDVDAARTRHLQALRYAVALGQDYDAALALDGLAQDELILGRLPESMEYNARAEAELSRMQASPRWLRQPTWAAAL